MVQIGLDHEFDIYIFCHKHTFFFSKRLLTHSILCKALGPQNFKILTGTKRFKIKLPSGAANGIKARNTNPRFYCDSLVEKKGGQRKKKS